ncbi:hypothetical protein EMIHUDRAFT_231839 [Emiliania huxleyi CCMP1516]|uniref:Uncharacterized protein n=2 Tax=Emiliania huxleyi TaxID=2903 RepID=A0A0D3K6R7_EMIH1|nr:hypothetical protein EMIHUDRAFT_231839 [Emiliania huxleyi CCMP1516]EOD31452.1 hypothetical protein EMIHUDRAFT_231839 [Emiliania huxleyi CCMP1516]|eukprot:XP_005783881.1 hypothetical protein EMIHUDRAFT_231839 [Emiliania huxleyi CCMP1516]
MRPSSQPTVHRLLKKHSDECGTGDAWQAGHDASLYNQLYSTSLYNAGSSSRGGCRALQLYSAPERSTSLQLYTALQSALHLYKQLSYRSSTSSTLTKKKNWRFPWPHAVSGFHVGSHVTSVAAQAGALRSLHRLCLAETSSGVDVSLEPTSAGADCGCAEPQGVVMNDVRVTGRKLRSMTPRLAAAGVAGPLFISVGRPDQLKQFLEVNPELTGAKALIDDSPDFAGYRAAGFNLKLGEKQLEKPPDFKPPKAMGMGKWMTYLKNVGSLSPVPKGMKFGEFPEGVKVLGGTYAIDCDEVLFAHSDEVPGATPNIEEVLAAAGAA